MVCYSLICCKVIIKHYHGKIERTSAIFKCSKTNMRLFSPASISSMYWFHLKAPKSIHIKIMISAVFVWIPPKSLSVALTDNISMFIITMPILTYSLTKWFILYIKLTKIIHQQEKKSHKNIIILFEKENNEVSYHVLKLVFQTSNYDKVRQHVINDGYWIITTVRKIGKLYSTLSS